MCIVYGFLVVLYLLIEYLFCVRTVIIHVSTLSDKDSNWTKQTYAFLKYSIYKGDTLFIVWK